jgi:hypothetical protein
VKNVGNLHTGDLFVINVDEHGSQKLVLQVEEVRSGPPGNAGESSSTSPSDPSLPSFVEIHMDDAIKKIFPTFGFMRRNHQVQKVAIKEVRIDRLSKKNRSSPISLSL